MLVTQWSTTQISVLNIENFRVKDLTSEHARNHAGKVYSVISYLPSGFCGVIFGVFATSPDSVKCQAVLDREVVCKFDRVQLLFWSPCLPDLLCRLCSVQLLTLSSFQLFSQHLTQAVFSVGVVIVIPHCLMERDKEFQNTPNEFIFYTAHVAVQTYGLDDFRTHFWKANHSAVSSVTYSTLPMNVTITGLFWHDFTN